MNLRTRLAVGLAALAGLSVAVVSSINYATTDQQLRAAVDASLRGFAADISLSTKASQYCEGSQGSAVGPTARTLGGPEIIQCVRADGTVVASVGPDDVRLNDVSTSPEPVTQTIGGRDYRVVAVELPYSAELRIARDLAETERVLDSVRDRSVGVGLAVILLAAAAGALIARWTSGPIVRLTATAEAITETGDLGIPVPAGRRDETGRLARAFAAMLGALTHSREQQQHLIQDAGHELRTPLTSLRTNVDTLRRYPQLDDESRDRVLADLDSELRELSTLVDELVALAAERYDQEEDTSVDLVGLAERAAERIQRRSGRQVNVDAAPASIVGKPERLLRAVGNLLDNAVKFTPAGTPIEVIVSSDRIEVRDHGPGIDPADLPRLFDRFYRAVAARDLPGSGLGLAIVEQIVRDCGGTVHAANHPDGGASFTLHLAAGPPSAEQS